MLHGWDWSAFFGYLVSPFLMGGAWTTLWLTVVSAVLGLLIGFGVAAARMSGLRAARAAAESYVWLLRGTPLLVQLVILYTGLPQIGIRFTVLQAAILGLSLNEGAYLSEVIRGAILSVTQGQRSAALALGMSRAQAMRDVILPQAFRIMIPSLGNSVNGLLKTTSLTSAISMEELLRRTNLLIQERFLTLELFVVASIYYLLMTSAWTFVQVRLERRFGRGYGTRTEDAGARR